MAPDPTQVHTFGPDCRLAPVAEPEAVDEFEGLPPIRAQFFHSSPISIDDPLSTATIPGASGSRLLRPFSTADNVALEKAWMKLASRPDRRKHENLRRNRSLSPSSERETSERLAAIAQLLVSKHGEKHRGLAGGSGSLCCPELSTDGSIEMKREFCALARRYCSALDRDGLLQTVMDELRRIRSGTDTTSTADARRKSTSLSYTGVHMPSFPATSLDAAKHAPAETGVGLNGDASQPPAVDDKPSVRLGTADATKSPVPALAKSASSIPRPAAQPGVVGRGRVRDGSEATPNSPRTHGLDTRPRGLIDVPVGVSRLHMVSLPTLQMRPIYWSPVNDMSVVMRATWFYRDTMVPLEPLVANQLEAGYRYLKPWGETWGDELRSALEVGPYGEEKVAHELWPDVTDKGWTSKDGHPLAPPISTDTFCAARCFRGEAASEGSLEPSNDEHTATMPCPDARAFPNHHVIYQDGSTAFLLKPSLKPSGYHGRRPVSKIMTGLTVGIPVVRGFDRPVWDRSHHNGGARAREDRHALLAAVARDDQRHRRSPCPGCVGEKQSQQVTDLVLVAHGIGQKFAERVESYHFTHAINAFRRAVHVEMKTPAVQAVLGHGRNCIMVLPINWRQVLSFEAGGPMSEEDKEAHAPEWFGLKDIEPNSIKSVRSLISDVMFDIPFYMSHHKPKMISALVAEANRVYRLWCANNTGFAQNGRVHLVAHSLGSAMAIDILSKQPTSVPRLNLSPDAPESKHLEFDTTNLFLLGSPAGFFLLLERGNLLPRRGRSKPGADSADCLSKDVVGEAGMFGCLAVDNIYNILAKEDPIAYLLNGTIDPIYAASLRTAHVPSTKKSLFKSVREAMGMSTATAPAPRMSDRPPALRLPSQLELEVRDFTREEIAEKKAFLLNDNGQVDYHLQSGGSPLEILNILGAHTGYWANLDLVRLLCIEISRNPGKQNTLLSMRAIKLVKRPLPGPR